VYALIFTVFVDTVGFGIVLPLLPLYAQAFGASPELVTLVAVSFTMGQALFGPFWGWMSDRLGRKPVLLLTISGTLCAYVLLAFTSSLMMLFLVRFIGGAMAANMGVANALVADVTTPEDRTRNIARLSAAAGLGFVAGPAIGGILAGVELGRSPFFLPYLTAAIFSACALVLAVTTIKETVGRSQRSKALERPFFRGWHATLQNSQTRVLLFLMFAPPFVFAGIEVVIVLWSERAWGWGPQENGYFYAWMGGCHVFLQWLLIGPLAKWLGERSLITIGALSLGAGCVLMPLVTFEMGLYIAALLMILGTAACTSSLNSLLSQSAEASYRGTQLGLGQAFAGSGRIVGPALSGIVFASVGIDWPFFLGAFAMLVMALASRLIMVRRASDIVCNK